MKLSILKDSYALQNSVKQESEMQIQIKIRACQSTRNENLLWHFFL